MNRDELLKILQDETDGFTEQSRLRDDVLDALEKVQELAINYSQCCKSDSEMFYCFNKKNKKLDRCMKQCSTCKEIKLMQ